MMASRDNRELFADAAAGPVAVGRRNLILGLGATGASFARWLAGRGESALIADTRSAPPQAGLLASLPGNFELVTGEFTSKLLDEIDRVLVSPGIPRGAAILRLARERSIPVFSDIDLFVAEVTRPLVAVTGSNAKSTVVSLLTLMFRHAGVGARAGGNIGTPVLDLLHDREAEVFVLELSSFQLDRTARLPARAATILNVSPDHLDWHGDYAAYISAKQRVLRDAETIVMNRHEPHIYAGLQTGPGISFGLDVPAEGQFGLCNSEGRDWLCRGAERIVAADELFSRTQHDQLNALAAMALGSACALPTAAMANAAREFEPLPHRHRLVAETRGIRFVNDSKATNVGAALASIRSVAGGIVLIAGGDAKDADLAPIADALQGRLRGAALIGRSAIRLADLLSPLAPVYIAKTMREAVGKAVEFASPGDTVLLAPGCASQDMYSNYEERGEAFVTAVRELAI